MIKKLFIYMALALGLTACSDEVFDGPRETLPENGEIPISFVVPEMTCATRATDASGFKPDDLGTTVTMLVYDKDQDDKKLKLIDKKDFSNPTGKVTYTVPENNRKSPDLFFLFFTNDSKNPNRNSASFTEGSELVNDLKQTSESVISSDSQHLVMSGAASINHLLQMNPVVLYRNAARISVTNHEENTIKLDFPFEVYGPKTDGLLFVGGYGNHDKITLGTSATLENSFTLEGAQISDDKNVDKYVYVQPTYNSEGTNQKKSYVIIKAKYDDKWYYYCLNFLNHEEGVLDIKPNHYYEFQIKTKNMRAGYETAEEARKNPVALSSDMYIVVDHSPMVMNIVSDGMRTLGVNHTLTRDNSAEGSEYLYVRLVSNASDEQKIKDYNDFTNNLTESIKFGSNWVTLKNPADGKTSWDEAADEEEIGTIPAGSPVYDTEGYKTDGDKTGKLIKVKVYFTGKVTGNLETKATVSWKGLSRDVPVEWHRVFQAEKLYDKVISTMTYKDADGNNKTESLGTSSSDYFRQLAGVKNAQGEYTADPNVWGATADDNGGEARDQGLHFPMPYGSDPLNIKYTYTVTLQDLGDKNDYSWDYEIVGDRAITNYVEVSGANNNTTLNNVKPTFTISNSKGNGYEYGVGKMIITVTQGTGENKTETPYEIPLYHTGFFHKDCTDHLAAGLENDITGYREWTYYEVVGMEGLYWLDRNLGAHSSNMYLQSSTGLTYAGDQAAAGGYYRAAAYNKGGKPTMRTAICPPGYDFPTKDEYDKLRKSSAFNTATVGSYNDASYNAVVYNNYQKDRDSQEDGAKIKTVYFPKARYYNNSTLYGESRSGYYWTKTASSGVEKDEVGAWLNCFTLSGANTSFMNGEVDRSSSNHGYGMAIRCVAKDKGRLTGSTNRTSFFVTGATHVFLYTIDINGKKNGTTTWPGHTICTYNTASNTYNFAYESRVNSADDLYVIFNYKDKDGKIHTLSRNVPLADEMVQTVHTQNKNASDGGDKKILYSDDKGMDELVGWKLTNGVAPDYDSYPNKTKTTFVNDLDNDKKAYWNFTLAFNEDGTFNADDSKGGIGVPQSYPNYRIYWPKSYDGSSTSKGMNIFKSNNKNGGGGTELKKQAFTSYPSSGDYYYYEFTEADFNQTYVHVQVYNGETYGQKPYILKSSFNEEDIDGTTYKCYTVGTTVNNTESHASGQGGTPIETPTTKYRVYWKYDFGKNSSPFKGMHLYFSDSNNSNGQNEKDGYYDNNVYSYVGDYYYYEFTEWKKDELHLQGRWDNENEKWEDYVPYVKESQFTSSVIGGETIKCFRVSGSVSSSNQLSGSGGAPTFTSPGSMWIIGSLTGWSSTSGTTMTFDTVEGCFKATVSLSGEMQFNFADALGASGTNWDENNGINKVANRYGPDSDESLSLNTPLEIKKFVKNSTAGNVKNLKLNPGNGNYEVQFNPFIMKVKVISAPSQIRKRNIRKAVRR